MDTSLSSSELNEKYPLFLEAAKKKMVVEMKSGQALYLPAGWFHEVFSSNDHNNNGHLALNYWFHPPDNPSIEAPYKTDFWKNHFEDALEYKEKMFTNKHNSKR